MTYLENIEKEFRRKMREANEEDLVIYFVKMVNQSFANGAKYERYSKKKKGSAKKASAN